MANTVSLHSHPALDATKARRVAVEAGCDPRCVVRYLRGLPMQSTTRERVERALRSCELGHLIGYATHTAAAVATSEAAQARSETRPVAPPANDYARAAGVTRRGG